MKNFIYRKKPILISLVLLVPLLIFTNMTPLEHTYVEALVEAQEFDQHIQSGNFSGDGLELLKAHRRLITTYVSNMKKPKSCTELYNLDPNMSTGVYPVYPEEKTLQRVVCVIENQSLTAQVEVEEKQSLIPECIKLDNCPNIVSYKRRVTCAQFYNGLKKCNVDGIITSINLISESYPGGCVYGKSFYYHANAVYIKDHCYNGVFDVGIIPVIKHNKPATYLHTNWGGSLTLTPKAEPASGATYQWFKGDDPIDATESVHYQSPTFTTPALYNEDDGALYRVEITYPDGSMKREAFMTNVDMKSCEGGHRHGAYIYKDCPPMPGNDVYGYSLYICRDGFEVYATKRCTTGR